MLIAFIRANYSHPFQFSVLPLLSEIRKLAMKWTFQDVDKLEMVPPMIHLDQFIGSKFVQSHLQHPHTAIASITPAPATQATPPVSSAAGSSNAALLIADPIHSFDGDLSLRTAGSGGSKKRKH